MSIQISKRLKLISKYVITGKPILDIGSNHAILPIYLIQKNMIPHAIASEVTDGPYNQALDEIRQWSLESLIDIRLGDGFDVLKEKDRISTIFICGMGGKLIENIIKNGIKERKIKKKHRLVLQPNRNESDLRRFLYMNNYSIVEENILNENKKYYEVIVAEYNYKNICYTDIELIYGPILLKEKNTVFKEKWKKQLCVYENILKQLNKKENSIEYEKTVSKINQIKKVIK